MWKRGVNVMCCILTATLLPKCRVFCWQDVCARFYHNPFISSVAGNSVLHHCYVVFNAFSCLHISPPTQFICDISVTNLYKLIVSEMDSLYSSSLFFFLLWIRGKKKKWKNNFNVKQARYPSLGGMDCLNSLLIDTFLWRNQIVNLRVKWFIFPNSL